MKRVAAEIAHKEPRIDVLINNAGAMFSSRRLTEDGLEYTFALNHMAYFVSRSKLCNILFTRELARRLHGTGVTANACIPASSPRASATKAAA